MLTFTGLTIMIFLQGLFLIFPQVMFDVAKVKLLPGAPLEDVHHVVAGGLEVGGGVVGL